MNSHDKVSIAVLAVLTLPMAIVYYSLSEDRPVLWSRLPDSMTFNVLQKPVWNDRIKMQTLEI